MDTFWAPDPDDDEDPVMALWRRETEARRMSQMPRDDLTMPQRVGRRPPSLHGGLLLLTSGRQPASEHARGRDRNHGIGRVCGVVGAAPASAVSSGCAAVNGIAFSGAIAVAAAPGDYEAGEVLTITWSNLSVPGGTVTLRVPSATVVDSRTGAGSLSYTFPSNINTGWSSRLDSGSGDFALSSGVPTAIVVDEGPEPAPIPAWVQAYGRDKDATCIDGWDASWQSCAEPVTGGWVCTRSIPSLG